MRCIVICQVNTIGGPDGLLITVEYIGSDIIGTILFLERVSKLLTYILSIHKNRYSGTCAYILYINVNAYLSARPIIEPRSSSKSTDIVDNQDQE
jgi:hypothetical protein